MTKRGTTIVLFGITGDLAQKKLLPALYDLFVTGRLGDTQIVGFSRREFNTDEIREFVKKTLTRGDIDEKFLDLVTYVDGQFDDLASYQKLAKHLAEVCDKELGDCSNKLFYLSVPPSLYEMITTHISKSGLSVPCGGEDGFARILIEKPFGKDLETAQKLDLLLGELFQEEQIYRIDHYVAKDAILNILNVHRRGDTTENKWDKENIERVEISLYEKAIVGNRGATYDGVGAFRDVGQNHMLQMLALIAMHIPEIKTGSNIQEARAKVLEHLIPATSETFKNMKRGQYVGYKNELGVSATSTTETYFEIETKVDSGPLAHVPFILRSGKALYENKTEVRVIFKDGTEITINVPPEHSQPAYQKILLDCIAGDQTVFISTREIMAQWSFVTPIVLATEKTIPVIYPIGAHPDTI